MRRVVLALLICVFLVPPVQGAKIVSVIATWTPPTTNTDGTPLTNLAGVTIAWGTCSAPDTFGTTIGQKTVSVPATSTVIVPVGTPPFCFQAQAVNTAGVASVWSNVVEWSPPPTLGQPTQFSAVIHFNLSKVKS